MGIAEELGTLDATAQADLVRSGQVTATELVDAAIAAAERVNPTINAIIHPRYAAARGEAARAGAAPFGGVPMVVKDLGCAIGGEPMHMGSRGLKNLGVRAPHDSFLYRRFRAAGFVAIGRTNTPEWGSTITTEPVAYTRRATPGTPITPPAARRAGRLPRWPPASWPWVMPTTAAAPSGCRRASAVSSV